MLFEWIKFCWLLSVQSDFEIRWVKITSSIVSCSCSFAWYLIYASTPTLQIWVLCHSKIKSILKWYSYFKIILLFICTALQKKNHLLSVHYVLAIEHRRLSQQTIIVPVFPWVCWGKITYIIIKTVVKEGAGRRDSSPRVIGLGKASQRKWYQTLKELVGIS